MTAITGGLELVDSPQHLDSESKRLTEDLPQVANPVFASQPDHGAEPLAQAEPWLENTSEDATSEDTSSEAESMGEEESELGSVDLSEESMGSPPPLVGGVVVSPQLAINETSLFMSARCGEFNAIIRLLTDEPSEWDRVLLMRDQEGHSLLHWACLFDNVEFIRVSCDRASSAESRTAYVNARSNNGQTAAMWAAIKGNTESIKLLWKRFSANLTLQDSLKADAGILAVQHHQYNTVLLLAKWLHDHRFHPFETRDVSGCTAVHWAAYKGDLQMLRILHYLKASMDSADNQGMTPLHRAASEGWSEAALFLKEKCRANPALKNSKNESAVDIAKRVQNTQLMAALAKSETDARLESRGPLGSNWSLPGFFVCVISSTVISFFVDFYATATIGLSVGFVVMAVTAIITYSDLLVGDPGFVKRRPNGNSAVEELQNKLDSPDKSTEELGLSKLCVTCWEYKSVERRMKHCSVCDKCVEGFDHHCAWINNCVAEKNHREFVLMVFSVWAGMILFMFISVTACVASEASFFDFLLSKPLLIPLWFVHAIVIPWLTLLFGHQLRSIALNMNTNELVNMYRYSHFWETAPNLWEPVEAQCGHPDGHSHSHGHSHGHSHEGHTHGPGETCSAKKPKGKRFKNPFDQGGTWANCKYFWFRQRAHRYSQIDEIQMADVSHVV